MVGDERGEDGLPLIRERGYAIDEGQVVEGIRAIAVRSAEGRAYVVAALSDQHDKRTACRTRGLPSLLRMLRQEVAAVKPS
jgi:DNA-binding IclR family transcriptional regulator